jgi:hypothetical protein
MAVKRVHVPQVARSKYHARATTVDGIRFHSAKEARRYGTLKLLQRAHEIQGLELQRVFLLSVGDDPESPDSGTVIGKYIADFSYFDLSAGKLVVEDVKGFKTPLYRWKKKHVEAQYGIQIREI